MIEFTQTSLAPRGNCWQTAVACLLEVEPSLLPDQTVHDYEFVDGQWRGQSYNNFLQAYLRKHHDLAYVELHLPEEALAMIAIREPGWHLMIGRTVRSNDLPGRIRHCVVGRYGQVVWDPHPSRAGLTDEIKYALLVPFPEEWKEHDFSEKLSCVCPACS